MAEHRRPGKSPGSQSAVGPIRGRYAWRGDSFASGLIYGFLTSDDPQTAMNYGAAHGALAMTTHGDTSMVIVKEVEKIMVGGGARVVR